MRRRPPGAATLALCALVPLGCVSVFRSGSPGSAHAMPEDAERVLVQAENAAAGGDPGTAIRLLEPLLDVEPPLVPVHRLYQDLSLRTGPREPLVERYRTAAASRPSARSLLLLARVLPPGEESDSLADRAAELAPDDPWVHFARGYRDRSRGRLEPAEESFARALSLDPDFPEALLEGAETAYLLHDEGLATERLERLHSLRPDDRGAMMAFAAVLAERQEFELAEEVLRESLERRPQDGEVEIALTSVLIDRERFDEAKSRLDDLAVRFPRSATVAFNRAVIAEVHERDYAAALAFYEQYLALGGEDTLRVSRWMEKIRAGDVPR